MKLEEFIKGFVDLFEDTDPSEVTPTTIFQELDEWDSLMLLTAIAYFKTSCGKDVMGKEINACTTVEDLYHLVESK